MDMLEDYLRAVSRLLPKLKREDIIAELRDEILTRIEAREEDLDRKLTPDESEDLLRDFGHPIVVAARYREGPQYCVGPALYPFWMFAVRLAVLIEVCVSVIVLIAHIFSGVNVGAAFAAAIGSGITGTMTLIGFATVAAWIVEKQDIDITRFRQWRVRDLRFLDFAPWEFSDIGDWFDRYFKSGQRAEGMRRAAADAANGYRDYGWTTRRSAAGRGVAAIVFGSVLVLWWLGVISFGLKLMPAYSAAALATMHIDPGALSGIDWPAMKVALYWPVLAYFCTMIAFGVAVLVWPRAVRLRGLIDIAIGSAVLALIGWVWFSSPLAPIVSVPDADVLMQRLKAFTDHPNPVPLPIFVTIFLLLTAFGGFCRAVGGVWEAVIGAPRYYGNL